MVRVGVGCVISRRLGQAAGIVLSSLVGLEVTLRIGALLAHAFFSRDATRVDASSVTILCVGDSHTYGAPLPREQSYPAQLQAALDQGFSSPHFEVLNLGVPGVNSAFVANRLERQILELRPHAVVAWVGWNNQWNALETRRGAHGRLGSPRAGSSTSGSGSSSWTPASTSSARRQRV